MRHRAPAGLVWRREVPPPTLIKRDGWYHCRWYEKHADGENNGVLVRDHRHALGTRDTKEARRRFAQWQLDISDGRPIVGEKSLLGKVIETYINAQGNAWQAKTKCRNQAALNNVKRLLGEVSVTAPKFRAMVEHYRDQRLGEKATPRTVNLEVQVLGAALKHTARRAHGFVNPLAGIKALRDPSAMAAALSNRRRLTVEEIGRIEAVVEGLDGNIPRHAWLKRAWLAAQFMLATGLRRGELINLRRKDVNGGHIRLRVRPDWQPKRGHERDVPIMPEAAEVLSEVLKIRGCEFLFVSPRSRKWDPDSLTKLVKDLYVKAGLDGPEDLGVHTLRHTFNSRLAELGVSREVRAKVMGHSTLSLQDRYTHLEPKTVDQALASLSLYGQPQPSDCRQA